MVNNMIRNDLPYAPPVNGRWYKIFLENDNGTIKKTLADINCTISVSDKILAVYIDAKYKLLSYIIDPTLSGESGSCNVNLRYTQNRCGITFSNIDLITDLIIYIYCVRK